MKKIKILYRADGGHPVGMGHVMRALRIIRELSSHFDLDVLLVSRHNGTVTKLLDREAPPYLNVHWLTALKDTIIPVLGAREFVEAAREFTPEITIIDALDTPEEDMRLISRIGSKTAVLDDRGPGRVYADLIANFLVRDPDPSFLSNSAQLLEGPGLAPLGPEYGELDGRRRLKEPESIKTVVVTMGGADAVGLAVKVAKELVRASDIELVRFSIGPAFQHLEELKRVVESAKWRYELLVNVPSLLPVFLGSDLAVVAGGITMHEVACCGVPSVAVCQPIDHQLLVAGWLDEAGAMLNLGYGEELQTGRLAEAIVELSGDPAKRQRMAEAGPATVDGLGTKRLAAAIAALITCS